MSIRSAQDLINLVEDWLWRDLDPNMPRWYHNSMRGLQIAWAVIRDIAEGHVSLRAMSLVYYTVIAIVPLLALTFAVLKGLGVHNAMEPALLGLLQPFLGEYANQITTNVVSFVDNVRVDVLSVVSLGVLLYTVLTMMQQIELTFNYIWSITQPRTLANRVSEYLFAVLVSPLLILVSVGIASWVSSTFFVSFLSRLTFGAWLLHAIAVIMPALFMSLAFALAFIFIPNTRVRFSSAFLGGVVTMLAWKSMAWVFQNFITVNSANAIIYAAFFALILLMLFIYLGWLMLLIGSSVAFYHQFPSKTRTGRKPLQLSLELQEELSLSIAYLVVKRFILKRNPWSLDELQSYMHMSGSVLETALQTLIDVGFISVTDEQPRRYLPLHSVEDMSISELRTQLRRRSSLPLNLRALTPEQEQVHQLLTRIDEHWINSGNDLTFRQLLEQQHHHSDENS
ncbi:MAG TPA: YihY/virulence factor BrkB family protein [Pseudohongiella sp.]|nr:YihY/virulence factor BrkB family protein [Pseudohongiella sp.]